MGDKRCASCTRHDKQMIVFLRSRYFAFNPAERLEDRSQRLSLRNPWIDSIGEIASRRDARKSTGVTVVSRIPPGCIMSRNATRGFEDSTPGYDL